MLSALRWFFRMTPQGSASGSIDIATNVSMYHAAVVFKSYLQKGKSTAWSSVVWLQGANVVWTWYSHELFFGLWNTKRDIQCQHSVCRYMDMIPKNNWENKFPLTTVFRREHFCWERLFRFVLFAEKRVTWKEEKVGNQVSNWKLKWVNNTNWRLCFSGDLTRWRKPQICALEHFPHWGRHIQLIPLYAVLHSLICFKWRNHLIFFQSDILHLSLGEECDLHGRGYL